MLVCRALLVVALILAIANVAAAQFGGMPGLPGGPPGSVPGAEGFSTPPARPPACQQLVALRDEVQRYGQAIQTANQRKASAQEACRLFRAYLSAEMKFVREIEEHGSTCGVPPELRKQAKESHTKAWQIGKEVCEAAAQGSRALGRWPPGDHYIRDEIELLPFGTDAQLGGPPSGIPGCPRCGLGGSPLCPDFRELATEPAERSKHGKAIEEANNRKDSVQEACSLFKTYLSAEQHYVKGIEEHGQACGLLPYDLNQVRERYVRAARIGKQVCEAAAAGSPQPAICQELIVLRNETDGQAEAIQKATERKALREACRLLRNRVAVETKFMKAFEEHGGTCGARPEELKLARERHAWALWIGRSCGT